MLKKPETNKTVRLHIASLPGPLHRDIKVAAATEGVSLKDWVIEALKSKLAMDTTDQPYD